MLYIAHATCEHGAEVLHKELVETNLSGRSIREQITLRINSRVSRMLDKGYKRTRYEAIESSGNQLGLSRPMLALRYERVKRPQGYEGTSYQKKLDGHRALTTADEGGIIQYSRQGKLITAPDHIHRVLKGRLTSDITLDGELYCHGVPLQTLSSWIKARQANTYKLWYVVYDLISPDSDQIRYSELKGILGPLLDDPQCPVKLLPSRPWQGEREMFDHYREAKSKGFEGLILRTNDKGYEDGVRSSSLLKVKCTPEQPEMDMEVTVKDIIPSSAGWAICVCLTDEGVEFLTSAPGSIPEKTEVMMNKDKYIGRRLTIEFPNYTIDRVPFHARALRWWCDV
jgi:DNA ligase-1